MNYFVKEVPKSMTQLAGKLHWNMHERVQILVFSIIDLKGKISTTRLFDKKKLYLRNFKYLLKTKTKTKIESSSLL